MSAAADSRTCQSGGHGRERRLGRFPIEPHPDLYVAERELFDRLVPFVEQASLEQEPGADVGPKLVAVARSILGLEDVRLRLETGDTRDLGLAELIIRRQRRKLLRKQRRERVVHASRLDANHLGIGVIAAHLLAVADDLPRRTVEIG